MMALDGKSTWGALCCTLKSHSAVKLNTLKVFVLKQIPRNKEDCIFSIVHTKNFNSQFVFKITRKKDHIKIKNISKSIISVNNQRVELKESFLFYHQKAEIEVNGHFVYLKVFISGFDDFFDGRLNTIMKPIEVLHAGQYLVVHKMFRFRDKRYLAVKSNRQDLESYDIFHGLDSIQREINIVKRLDHENIIKRISLLQNCNIGYIVMEYGFGGNLLQRIKQRDGITETTSKFIFKQIISAVDYLHSKNIAHRDLNPSNIILMSKSTKCVAKLTNFSHSCIGEDVISTYGMAGSHDYMAPELISNCFYDRLLPHTLKVDIWSLGVSVFLSVSNKLPFDSETCDLRKHYRNITNGIKNTHVNGYNNLSIEGKFFIQSCLSSKVRKRPNATLLLQNDWFKSNDFQ